ncbi:type II toxin-antitoxin system RelE/ParE family toxin [Asticcacaulis sp. DW145]|uniref:Toxin n=1 Tax=Asticcacaulis currens TaxID=2984210 RepID=A0ABT5IBP9_9CAUL|nr:type II toxin-antitoxin system RelE/ParE family toxin [Asticcacaulis currens]BEV10412.1 type II toxin-antitoxin system RelE/ParE family toxin [Asticcacaulis sp. DW145]
MTFRLTSAAETDLIQLYLFGRERFGFQQAEAYYDDLNRAFGLLAEYPAMGRLRKELNPPMHTHPFRSHIIFYQVEAQGLLIVRVRHASEDWNEFDL